MHLAIRTTANETAWSIVLRQFGTEIHRVLAGDPAGRGINQHGGERLGGRIKTEEHAWIV
jgi:hypothetical protein